MILSKLPCCKSEYAFMIELANAIMLSRTWFVKTLNFECFLPFIQARLYGSTKRHITYGMLSARFYKWSIRFYLSSVVSIVHIAVVFRDICVCDIRYDLCLQSYLLLKTLLFFAHIFCRRDNSFGLIFSLFLQPIPNSY